MFAIPAYKTLCRTLATGFMFITTMAIAQPYPNKPIRLIVPFAAGSATDAIGRTFGQKMGEILGQPVIVENKAGAVGSIGADAVAKSAPDGYTLLLGTNSSISVVRLLIKNVPYDPEKDFAPISLVGELPQVVVVNNDLPVKTLAELIAYAKKNPGKINYASPNSVGRFSAEMLATMSGVKFFGVPYKSSPQALTDLISGEVQLFAADPGLAAPQMKAGRLRALAITGPKRSTVFPDLPTVAEAAQLPGYELLGLFGIYAPAGTNNEIILKLNAAVVKAAQEPEVRARMKALSMEVQTGTPEELALRMRQDAQRWGKVAKEVGIQPE